MPIEKCDDSDPQWSMLHCVRTANAKLGSALFSRGAREFEFRPAHHSVFDITTPQTGDFPFLKKAPVVLPKSLNFDQMLADGVADQFSAVMKV